jgi:hypothetical protein
MQFYQFVSPGAAGQPAHRGHVRAFDGRVAAWRANAALRAAGVLGKWCRWRPRRDVYGRPQTPAPRA